MDKGTKEKLKYTREDIRPVFNNLTNNTEELFNVMYISKVILSGSRPSNFFKPECSSRVSNYNFYIEDNTYYIAIFMTYIISIGIYWSLNKENNSTRLHNTSYIWTRFQLIRGILNRYKRILDIQLI